MNLGIETETIEFKKSTGELKEAVYSISAILNKHQHGELYFGVKAQYLDKWLQRNHCVRLVRK